jgi:hypothetical protein
LGRRWARFSTGKTSYRLEPHITRGLCEAASLNEKKKLAAFVNTQIMIQKNTNKYICTVAFYMYPSTRIKKTQKSKIY